MRAPTDLDGTKPFPDRWLSAMDERWPGIRRRAAGLALAVAIEAALFLVLLTLGQGVSGSRQKGEALTSVSFAPPAEPEKPSPRPRQEEQKQQAATPSALPRPAPAPVPAPPSERALPFPLPAPAAVLPVARSQPPAAADPSRARAVVRDDMQGPVGPPDTGYPGDSERVAGSGPNGEPLYAARWYREPSDDELRGYLSTASGPGWALINCQTAPGYRVENCVLVDEYPDNGGLGRAVLAAAWQFKVRPPQVGGRSMVGEWVRIRITYDLRRK
ncbi:hypothetical protein GCM10011515_02930 [Tsuneonella deserti]|uniref:Protein TonB n=1 Tax=Tsuneonella deserti TaxID=2035528 RepID=A0ABQ1S1W9_9SPHN|nr:hypothetical protein [Tsuneonella deserti]GGD86861.1 hypothetical protein GCM10011515_02930 [Tsuneonella deserti]